MTLRTSLFVAALVAALAGPAAASAAEPLPAETVAARQALFGRANVDAAGALPADRIVVSWFGVSSLAVSFGGDVALLDTYINGTAPTACSGPDPQAPSGYTPLDYDQLAALRPATIFIGHGHYDHECRTGELATRTGATVVGLPQDCDVAREQADAYDGSAGRIRCVEALPAGSAFGDRSAVPPLVEDLSVTAVRNIHSGAEAVPASNEGGAESTLYAFSYRGFRLLWNDSAGPARRQAPAVLDTLRDLAPFQAEFGASLGLGVVDQGYRDTADYAQAAGAAQLWPLHQDLVASRVFSVGQRPLVEQAVAQGSPSTKVNWLQDPDDYLRPITFPVPGPTPAGSPPPGQTTTTTTGSTPPPTPTTTTSPVPTVPLPQRPPLPTASAAAAGVVALRVSLGTPDRRRALRTRTLAVTLSGSRTAAVRLRVTGRRPGRAPVQLASTLLRGSTSSAERVVRLRLSARGLRLLRSSSRVALRVTARTRPGGRLVRASGGRTLAARR